MRRPSFPTTFGRIALAIVLTVALPSLAYAQDCGAFEPERVPIVELGGRVDIALRDSALVGRCPSSLIRSPSSLARASVSGRTWIAPSTVFVWNSDIPVTPNLGSLWAGRGPNARISGGFRVDRGQLTVIVAPELAWSRNEGFLTLITRDTSRSVFASPWYAGNLSADLPVRFGADAFAVVTPGQSTAQLRGRFVTGGWTSENQWWGPGIRNAIVMSNNAAGIPQLFLRTSQPLATPVGTVEGRFMLGQLTGSRFFEPGTASYRSISAAVVTLRPPFDSGLTIGAARAVYAPVNGIGGVPKHWADVLWRWNQADRFSQHDRPLNQILSLFYQWIIPGVGFESYGEWAQLTPPSIGHLIRQPQSGQGFTLGLQSLRATGPGRAFRVQAEATMLHQTPPNAREEVPTFYTSHRSPAGYTQRGKIIGASIGPGGSSQFLAADVVRSSWTVGLQAGRIQWNGEAYYSQPTGISYKHHDVSVFAGLRGGADLAAVSFSGELVLTDRMNFLFQGTDPTAFDDFYDVGNVTFKLSISRRPSAITRRIGMR